MQKLMDQLKPRLEANDLNYETVESQKEDTGRSFSDLTRFLSLVGFIALLLGCTGVASAVHVYVKEKVNAIAILRCLGVKASQAFIIYLIQIVGIGFIGSFIGAVLGVVIQQFLPFIIKDFLPVKITTSYFMDRHFTGDGFRYYHLCFICIITTSLHQKNFAA